MSDETPSDAQMTDEQKRRVDEAYEQDRRDDEREEQLTAAQPVADDPAAT